MLYITRVSVLPVSYDKQLSQCVSLDSVADKLVKEYEKNIIPGFPSLYFFKGMQIRAQEYNWICLDKDIHTSLKGFVIFQFDLEFLTGL